MNINSKVKVIKIDLLIFFFPLPWSEADGQASGGSDSEEWIFTIREKDPKNLENGAAQPLDLQRNKVLKILTL